MDLQRINQLREHVGDSTAFVQITCPDLCQLVDLSKTDDAGLKRSAEKLARQKGNTSIPAQTLRDLLTAAESHLPKSAGGPPAAAHKVKAEVKTEEKPN